MAVDIIGRSDFLKKLSHQRKDELKKENEKLFQLLLTEDFIQKEKEQFQQFIWFVGNVWYFSIIMFNRAWRSTFELARSTAWLFS